MSETIAASRTDATASVETALAHIYQAAKTRMRSLASRFHPDLQPMGYSVLRLVMDNERMRSSDVATALGMDKGAVSRQVSGMREMGLVELQADPADGRASLVVPSAAAFAALNQFRSETSGEFGRIFADWPTEDIGELGRLLGKFNGSMH